MLRSRYPYAVLLAILCGGFAPGPVRGNEYDCGSLKNAYGPFDYTNPQNVARDIPIVEREHFNTDVQQLRRGQSSVNLMGDLDYVLRAVPNHHPALDAVARYQLHGGNMSGFRTADCYFDRALRFKPDDGAVYLIYGIYLHRKKNYQAALEQYQTAIRLMPDSADAHYNLGLLYVALNQLGPARDEAERAYALGYPLPGLRQRLIRLGAWKDSTANAAAPNDVGAKPK